MTPDLADNEPGSSQVMARASSARAWAAAILLTACFALSYIDRQIISLLVGPIKATLLISDTQMGLLQGVSFSLFYVLASVPLARLSDRGNRPRIMSICVSVWSMMTMLCGLAANYWQLLLARAGVAMGESGLPPAALTLMADMLNPKQLARATSIFMLAPFIGGGMALLLGGALYAMTEGWTLPSVPGVGVLERWQLVFIMIGAPGLLIGLLVLTIREPVRGQAASVRQDAAGVVRYTLTHWRFIVVYMLSIAAVSMLLNALIAWLPAAIMRSKGIDEQAVGLALGPIFLVCGSVGTLGAGFIIGLSQQDVTGRTLRLMRVCCVVLLPLAVSGPLMPSLTLELMVMACAILLISAVIGMSSLPLQFVVPGHMRAQSIAVLGLISALIGTGMGPVVVGVLSDTLHFAQQPLSLALALLGGVSIGLVIVMQHVVLSHHSRVRLDLRHSATA